MTFLSAGNDLSGFVPWRSQISQLSSTTQWSQSTIGSDIWRMPWTMNAVLTINCVLYHGIRVQPSGRLPSVRTRPDDSLLAGIPAAPRARKLQSFNA